MTQKTKEAPAAKEKPVVLALEKLNRYGEILFKDKDGGLYYLEEIKPGLYLLKPWNG